MFEIYTKEVEIKEPNGNVVKYKLRPLSGRFLPKLYSILGKMQVRQKELKGLSEEEKNIKSFEQLDEDTISKLHSLTFETLKKSYPKENEEVLNEFASQNLLQFLGALIEVNLGNGNNE